MKGTFRHGSRFDDDDNSYGNDDDGDDDVDDDNYCSTGPHCV